METEELPNNVSNTMLSCEVQPMYFAKDKTGRWYKAPYKQTRAYINLMCWKKNKLWHHGAYIKLKIINKKLAREMGVDMLRISLDKWMMRHYLQVSRFLSNNSNENKKVDNSSQSTIIKYKKYPFYYSRLEERLLANPSKKIPSWNYTNSDINKDIEKVKKQMGLEK